MLNLARARRSLTLPEAPMVVALTRKSHLKNSETFRELVRRVGLHKAVALRREWDESKHPRDPEGQFAESGSGGAGSGEVAPEPKLDPKVISVGGDEWNRSVARRLERDYQEAKPKLEALTTNAVGKSTQVEAESIGNDKPQEEDEGEENPPPFIPESWDDMNEFQQEDAKQQYMEKTESDFHQEEINSWQENGDAMQDAMYMVAEQHNKGDSDWLEEAIKSAIDDGELAENKEDDPPYTAAQLADAINIDYEHGDSEPKVTFNNKKLQDPSDKQPPPDPAQMELPNLPPAGEHDYSKHLTPDMREQLTKITKKAFEKEAENKVDDIEPPEYLKDSAHEYAEQHWDDGMSDKKKFEWVLGNTNIIDDASTGTNVEEPAKSVVYAVEALPKKYDPLNETTGNDYKLTQKLARYLSIMRAQEVLQQRGITGTAMRADGKIITDAIARADFKLWEAWKSSSTTASGALLQIAVAEELGGRLNKRTKIELDPDGSKKYADSEFASIGGYAGVKAYVRAKWEVTQYLLDKAGVPELKLYRGITLDDKEKYERLFTAIAKHYNAAEKIGQHILMPSLDVLRNGAASTTTDPKIANDWGSGKQRVVLRALVPRTAAVSLPVYGVNVHSEHEVVVAGVAWKSWDAWAGRAPRFEDQPMKIAA
jgi:hypothetical protein